ncbi:hypothetical protein [Methylotuvimicrobium alcaliphilum]|uniref:Uncharacterized protein n=1 Tax=Methylotuvimicrobium alcaliphilum (strain DSM 19304 / NCIMB 14124 / VKM B-2133 / 20Z) TaxID=1091494 RepID=G4SZU8_META2|nr:hypothetical protein [Methylotuvimicrobium alcaliphilum]CCE25548.1 conserved protein of unknown function [Methylotuvimicrobium alcaliphilum 20Z]
MTDSDTLDIARLDSLSEKLDKALQALAEVSDFAKITRIRRVFDTARLLMLLEGGCARVEARARQIEEAGVFLGSDWDEPQLLIPSLTCHSLKSSNADTVVVEALSELRLLAIAMGDYLHPCMSLEQAHHYLTQVLAINLGLLFGSPSEAEREQQGKLSRLPRNLFRHLAERIGYEHVIDRLIEEIWRILQQRPIQVDSVKQMITQIAVCQANPDIDLGISGQGADRLISSLYGATQACREDPGVEVYRQRLSSMDSSALQYEATGFARAMHDTGLVSPYHAVLLRYLQEHGDHLLSEALGLSSTGRDCLLCYGDLVRAMINETVYPQTAQAIYGLALLLERGVLYQPPVAPALWRQLSLPISPYCEQRLVQAFGPEPMARAWLMQGVLCMLGLPMGVGQGNNPTCQSARALSMWAYNDPDYMLQMVVWAARDDEIIIHFEGQPISSRESVSGVAKELPLDLDPVSLLVVPHLDRIYAEMGRRCSEREGDPHRWVNPEFHGWWSGRGFRINVDVKTGKLDQLEDFLRHFYASYHPYYNGNQPLIHPQPAGIAVTDSAGRFVGWHAITILRVALDPKEEMRVYFYNPNNDSGQNWGNGVEVDTSGNGERFGEASLPFEQFASRLYIFHYDPLERGELAQVSAEELNRVKDHIYQSWGADRLPADPIQASASQY